MHLVILEPYFTGSHAQWAKGYQRFSTNEITIFHLPGSFWKWRMHGGAITLAKQFLDSKQQPDFILASDMLDLTTFQALTRKRTASIPFAVYFHENQLTYPWSPSDRDFQKNRNQHYGFINYVSCLSSHINFFNSRYHMESFLTALKHFLKSFPDHNELDTLKEIQEKCRVLPLGIPLRDFDRYRKKGMERKMRASHPIVLWNHRWEYDKNPETFFHTMELLMQKGLDFHLVVLGQNFRKKPQEFERALDLFGPRILHWGYEPSFAEYATWLWASDLLPITSHQDFFGISILEAIYCECHPFLPKRLSYPELIPENLHQKYFYSESTASPNSEKEPKELVNRLTAALKNLKGFQQRELPEVVDKFSWETLAPVYDRIFSDLVASV